MTALRTVTVDGSPVHVMESGTGPAVLMLHGSGPGTTGSGAWATTAQALGTSWHLVAPDHAGFGRTPIPAGSRGGLRLWTEQAAGLMDALHGAHVGALGMEINVDYIAVHGTDLSGRGLHRSASGSGSVARSWPTCSTRE